MRLLTHNLLVCNIKACQAPGVQNFPLNLNITKWSDYDDESTMDCTKKLMTRLAEKIDWNALKETANKVSEIKLKLL